VYAIQNIAEVINGRLLSIADTNIEHLAYDSRKLQQPLTSLFLHSKPAMQMGTVIYRMPIKGVSGLLSSAKN
jgi:hypothetical protein